MNCDITTPAEQATVIDQDATRDALLAHLMRSGTYGHYWTPDGEPYTGKDGRTVTPRYTQWFEVAKPKPPINGWLDKNLYWGVHPCTQRGLDPEVKPNKQRSSVAIIEAVNCLFSEFDGKDYVQPDEYAPHLPPNYADLAPDERADAADAARRHTFAANPAPYKLRAWQHIERMPLRPSVIVDSGGGYQPYHLLADPVLITDDNRQHVADVQAAWVRLVGGDQQAKDLARVLRVPGTHNRKPLYGPDFPLVRIVEADFTRLYALADFERITEGLRIERQVHVASIGSLNGYHGSDYESAADALRRLAAWRCDDRAEWILVGHALKAGLGDSGLDLWEQWSRGSRKYQPGDCEARWKNLRPNAVTLATLIWRANEDSPRPRHRNDVEEYEYGFVVETPDPATLGELVPAEPAPAKHRTWPYAAYNGRMIFLRLNEKTEEIIESPIADFTAVIAEEIVDEGGAVNLVIEGEGLRRGPFRCEISGADFGSDAKLLAALTEATGGIDVVYNRMSAHLRPAIGKLTKEGSRPQRIRYYRTGWQDDGFASFLMPGMDDTTLISLPRQVPYATPKPDTDLTSGLLALTHLIDAMRPELTAPIVAALLMPPMLRPASLGNERAAVFIAGRTGSLKTSWTQTAMCLYGPGFSSNDNLLKMGEGATRNAIMAFAAHAHDLPLLIDNYKPNTGNGKHDFVNLIHNILEGGDRKRSERSGALRDSKLIRCIPIVTGEDLPRDDAASIARILLVTFEWQRGEPNDHLTAAQELSEHLCAVGWAWISWLHSDAGRSAVKAVAKTFPSRRAEWASRLSRIEKDSANIARVASNLAVNQLAWELACEHPDIGPAIRSYSQSHADGLRMIARTMAKSTVEALEAHQYRAALRELLSSGQYELLPRTPVKGSDHNKDRLLGWFDADGVYLLPAIALAAVKKLLGPNQLLISPQTLYGQMQQLDWVANNGKESTTKMVSVGGEKVRVLHLKTTFIEDDRPTEDEADALDALAESGL